jgi:hypothetical protein
MGAELGGGGGRTEAIFKTGLMVLNRPRGPLHGEKARGLGQVMTDRYDVQACKFTVYTT